MINQRVSHGEEPCYGHDPELDSFRRRAPRRRLRYKRGAVGFLLGSASVAVTGGMLWLHATGMLARAGGVSFWIAASAFMYFFADPVLQTIERRRRRRKIHIVK